MKTNKYEQCVDDGNNMVCEAVTAYKYTDNNVGNTVVSDDFERDWERAITIEEFSKRCDEKLKEMYGVS